MGGSDRAEAAGERDAAQDFGALGCVGEEAFVALDCIKVRGKEVKVKDAQPRNARGA